MTWNDSFQNKGLAAQTAAPMNVAQQEQDLPPGAPPYAGGPLANPPPTTPTPAPQSLSTLAAGGFNHAQIWAQGQTAPQPQAQQQSFARPASPAPAAPDILKKFMWSSAFESQ